MCRHPRKHNARGVQTGMNPTFLCPGKQFRQKINLEHRLSAGRSDSAGPVKRPVALHARKDLLRAHLLPVLQMPGVGIMAVQAAHGTSSKEHHKADSRSIHSSKAFHRMNFSHKVLLFDPIRLIFIMQSREPAIPVSPPQKQQGTGSGSRDLSCLYHFHMNYMRSWKVLAMTSSCCSLVSLIKFTAYPETRIVSCGYCSGCFCASKSVSRFNTLTFK